MIDPHPGLPDDTPIDRVRLPTRIRNVLAFQKIRTIGDVRELQDATLLSFYDLGSRSVSYLRGTLGVCPAQVCSASSTPS